MEMSAAKPIANAQNVMQLEHPKLGVIAYSADDIFFFHRDCLATSARNIIFWSNVKSISRFSGC